MPRAEHGKLALSGAVTVDTYAAWREAAAPHLGSGDLVIDWSAVETVDSGAAALLIAWQREAARGGFSITSTAVPPSLLALLDLYGLSELLAVA